MKKINFKIVGIGVVVLILLGLEFIRYSNSKKVMENLTTYSAMKVGSGNVKGYIDVNGKVEVNDTKKVFVDKKLKVDEVFVQEGDFIEKGQLLMTFDETERNNIERNLEREKLALSKLKRDYNVEKELYKIGGSSANSVKELEEEIRKVEINIEEYEEDLAKTAEKILSPVSGTITSLTAQENYLVDTDSPLMEIADLSDIKIVLEVPEYDVKNMYIGQKILLKPEAFEKKKSFPGKVTKISKISEVSETTSENILETEVKPDEVIPYIVPGFKVTATIYLDEQESEIIVSKTSVLESDKKYFVVVANSDGIVKRQEVEIENLEGDNVIVKKGLTGSETILITPDESLQDNQKVILQMRGRGSQNVKSGNAK